MRIDKKMKKTWFVFLVLGMTFTFAHPVEQTRSSNIHYPFIRLLLEYEFTSDTVQALEKTKIKTTAFKKFILAEFYQAFKNNNIRQYSIRRFDFYTFKAKLTVTFPIEFRKFLKSEEPAYYPQFILSSIEIYSNKYNLLLPHKFYGNINVYNTRPTRDLYEAVSHTVKKIEKEMCKQDLFSFYQDDNFWLSEISRAGRLVIDKAMDNENAIKKLQNKINRLTHKTTGLKTEILELKENPGKKIIVLIESKKVVEKVIRDPKNYHSVALKVDRRFKQQLRLQDTVTHSVKILYQGEKILDNRTIPGRIMVMDTGEFMDEKMNRTEINPVLEIPVISVKMQGTVIDVLISRENFLKLLDMDKNGLKVEEANVKTSLFQSMKKTDVLPRVYLVFVD